MEATRVDPYGTLCRHDTCAIVASSGSATRAIELAGRRKQAAVDLWKILVPHRPFQLSLLLLLWTWEFLL